MRLAADYGIIDIDETRRLDVYVVKGDKDSLDALGKRANHCGLLEKKLSDNRLVIGTLKSKDSLDRLLSSKFLRKAYIGNLRSENFIYGSKIDNETTKKIKDEILTIRCDECNNPGNYALDFVYPLDENVDKHFYKGSCLDHLNEVIDKNYSDRSFLKEESWAVTKFDSPSIFSPWKHLGMVKYNEENGRFFPTTIKKQ